jgi:hypothetical protein
MRPSHERSFRCLDAPVALRVTIDRAFGMGYADEAAAVNRPVTSRCDLDGYFRITG